MESCPAEQFIQRIGPFRSPLGILLAIGYAGRCFRIEHDPVSVPFRRDFDHGINQRLLSDCRRYDLLTVYSVHKAHDRRSF